MSKLEVTCGICGGNNHIEHACPKRTSIVERLERELEKFRQTRGSMPVGHHEGLLADALEEIKALRLRMDKASGRYKGDDSNV